eukprot:Nitzschia sp. Nitz4//scaffold167_size49223//4054//5847//NITZ4_007030-RA/size49223-processed-gene-0.29-mRNA-1//-1//CDS//3329538260//3310//frame0
MPPKGKKKNNKKKASATKKSTTNVSSSNLQEFGEFTVICKNGEEFQGSANVGKLLVAQSSVFKKLFEQAILSGKPVVLEKPEWEYHFVMALIMTFAIDEYIKLEYMPLYIEYMDAAKELDFDMRLCDMVEFYVPSPTKEHRFRELVGAPIRTVIPLDFVTPADWHTLLEQGVFLVPDKGPQLVVMKYGTNQIEKAQKRPERFVVQSNLELPEVMKRIQKVRERKTGHVKPAPKAPVGYAFQIKCQGGKLLNLSEDQAREIASRSKFFYPFFLGDTKASPSAPKVVKMERSDYAVVEYLVRACTASTIRVQTPMYEKLMKAAKEANLDLRLCDMVTYDAQSPTKTTRFQELLKAPERIILEFELNNMEWFRLLEAGILLIPYKSQSTVVLKIYDFDEPVPEVPRDVTYRENRLKYMVRSKLQTPELLKYIREVFKASWDEAADPTKESFRMWNRFKSDLFLPTSSVDVKKFHKWRSGQCPLDESLHTIREVFKSLWRDPNVLELADRQIRLIFLDILNPTYKTLELILSIEKKCTVELFIAENIITVWGNVTEMDNILACLDEGKNSSHANKDPEDAVTIAYSLEDADYKDFIWSVHP